MTLHTRPCDNPKLVFCTAPAPAFFWRSTLHKDQLGRARSGTREAVHPSLVSIKTHLPDAHVTRWPSGRARSRPPTAPLIGKDGAPERSSVPAIRQRVARSTSDLHGDTRHRVARVPVKIRRSSDHHSANARDTRSRAGCRKDRAFSNRKRFPTGPPNTRSIDDGTHHHFGRGSKSWI